MKLARYLLIDNLSLEGDLRAAGDRRSWDVHGGGIGTGLASGPHIKRIASAIQFFLEIVVIHIS